LFIYAVRPKSATQKAVEDRVFSLVTNDDMESDESDGKIMFNDF